MIVCFQNIDGRRIYRVWTEDEYMLSNIRVDFHPTMTPSFKRLVSP